MHIAPTNGVTEIRDFPKSLTGYNDLKKAVLTGLRNCINLQACSWTRDGALSSDILRALQPRHNLAKLEINGNHEGNYDPKLLVSFNRLTSLTIIMPSAGVVEVLPTWLDATANTLTSLTIICKVCIFRNSASLSLVLTFSGLYSGDRHCPD